MPISKTKSVQILDKLYSLKNFGIKPGLKRIKNLLKAVGNPERDFPSIIVGGTNGKGSVSVLVAEILKAAGYKTGLYTSPHLYRFNERIKVDGGLIGTAKIKSYASRMLKLPVVKKDKTTFFELTTAMAFKYFSEKKVDIAVLEVGLGGRYDATNVVSPLVSVITSVGLDHEEFLGGDVKTICREKAGIIKKGSTLVTGVSDKELINIIKSECREKGVKGYYIGKDFKASAVKSTLKGKFQKDNIAVALKTVEVLRDKGFNIKPTHIKKALQTVSWPCRQEEFSVKGRRVIIDSAHNVPGAKALRDSLGTKKSRSTLVFGVMKRKNVEGILNELLPFSSSVFLTSPKMEGAADTEDLKNKLNSYSGEVSTSKRVSTALKKAIEATPKGEMVVVAGSIFTAAEARKTVKRLNGKKA